MPSVVAPPELNRRALVWDSNNSSSLLIARTLNERGWTVDAIFPPGSPLRGETAFNGLRLIARAGADDGEIERLLNLHTYGLVSLHGDKQVQWIQDHARKLPAAVLRHFPPKRSIEVALSKARSSRLAQSLGIPVLPTRACRSREEAQEAAEALADPGGEVVMRGEGSSAGSAVRSHRAGDFLSPRDWAAMTTTSPVVMVQRRIRGPRVMVTVLYEDGVERASCAHEKICTWPEGFGVTALGRTCFIEEVHRDTRRLFEKLRWHGPANIEFRQSVRDGRWYFIEINPRVGASIGIQDRAGLDLASRWAMVAEGNGAELGPSQDYRSGVVYWWAIPMFALAIRHPGSVPWRALLSSLSNSDWGQMERPTRIQALRAAIWAARHT